MAYTNEALVENFIQRELTTNERGILAVIIPAIKKWIDAKLDSTFDEASATTRYYDGGGTSIDIDPATAITAVTSLDEYGVVTYTYVVGTEYIAEPQNETIKREIRKRFQGFPRGTQRIAVTAKFSEFDGGPPADIVILATRLASGLLNSGKTAGQGGDLQSESLEGHSVTYQTGNVDIEGISQSDPTVASILAQRKPLYIDDYDRVYRRRSELDDYYYS